LIFPRSQQAGVTTHHEVRAWRSGRS